MPTLNRPVDEQQRADRRRKRRRRRIIVYVTLFALFYGFFLWVPWEFDFIPRQLPNPNPPVDPDSRRLFAPGTRVLLVTAHPDDSAFYIGGFLTKLGRSGAEIHQIICTDGDKGFYGIFSQPDHIRESRREEARAELHAWGGMDLLFLGRSDGRLRADDALVLRIRKQIDVIQPEYVLCFDGDYPPRLSHQDHRRSGDAAELAAKDAPSVKWLMKFSTIAPNWVCDISDTWENQKRLLEIHKSQFNGRRLEMVTNMVEDGAVRDGERIGRTYGEGFRCLRLH